MLICSLQNGFFCPLGALVAQWVKRWPADLAISSSSPAWGGNLLNRIRDSIEHSLS